MYTLHEYKYRITDMLAFTFIHWCDILEAKINGYDLLRLDKGSLEQLRLSTEFQTPLMKIIEEMVCRFWGFRLFVMFYSVIVENVP